MLEQEANDKHKHFVCQVREEIAVPVGGKTDPVRSFIDRGLGLAGLKLGVQFPTLCDVIISKWGPAFTLTLGSEVIFGVESMDTSGMTVIAGLLASAKLAPEAFFGVEQAIRWIQTIPAHYWELRDAARAALGEPDGYEKFANLLIQLVQERAPLTDVKGILEAIAAAEEDGSPEDTLERLRRAIRESSAKLYLEYFHADMVYHASAELAARLDTTVGIYDIREDINAASKGSESSWILVSDDAKFRRRLWVLADELFRGSSIAHPVFVISPDEMPETVPLPESKGLIDGLGA